MGRIARSGIVLSLLLGLSAGCSTEVLCPAIGWVNAPVRIHLEGNAGDVAVVELCADGVCAASTPTATSVPFVISPVDASNWQISLESATPDVLTLRALSSAGHVLVEQGVALEWRRVGGTAQCGGPSEAEPVTLEVPK